MTKQEFNNTISLDLARFNYNIPGLKDRILHNEVWYIFRYIQHLRYIEYHGSTSSPTVVHKLYHKLAYLYHWYKYKHLGFKLHFTIYPNTCDGGLRIYHAGGFVHVGDQCKIGRNCTLLPGVVFGNKTEKPDPNAKIVVGDNCYFGLGAKIFGSVKIGNNVTVGANAIVTKDVPDGATVVGANKIIVSKDGK